MKKLIISAPFGNWFTSQYATSTIGTYTYYNRSGVFRVKLLWKMLRTIRPIGRIGGWVNKLGLPSPGIQHLKRLVEHGYKIDDKILSIHGFDEWEWVELLNAAKKLQPNAIELNVSCPNVGQQAKYSKIFKYASETGLNVIVKLPPISYNRIFEQAMNADIRIFHCCNTYPTISGGLSGTPLKPMSMACISNLLKHSNEKIDIIAGGGIKEKKDIVDYKNIGANRFAVATMLFNVKYCIPSFREKQMRSLAGETYNG